MSRALLTLNGKVERDRAIAWIQKAPTGTRVTFQAEKRSLPQNDRLWLCLTEISRQLLWHGQKYTTGEWKDYFMHAYRGEKWMPFEDGGMVPIGRATSDLAKHEFGELMTLMEAFCARQNVKLPWDEEVSA